MSDMKPVDGERVEVRQPEVPPCDLYAACWYEAGPKHWRGIASRNLSDAEQDIERNRRLGSPVRFFRLRDPQPAATPVDEGKRERLREILTDDSSASAFKWPEETIDRILALFTERK